MGGRKHIVTSFWVIPIHPCIFGQTKPPAIQILSHIRIHWIACGSLPGWPCTAPSPSGSCSPRRQRQGKSTLGAILKKTKNKQNHKSKPKDGYSFNFKVPYHQALPSNSPCSPWCRSSWAWEVIVKKVSKKDFKCRLFISSNILKIEIRNSSLNSVNLVLYLSIVARRGCWEGRSKAQLTVFISFLMRLPNFVDFKLFQFHNSCNTTLNNDEYLWSSYSTQNGGHQRSSHWQSSHLEQEHSWPCPSPSLSPWT